MVEYRSWHQLLTTRSKVSPLIFCSRACVSHYVHCGITGFLLSLLDICLSHHTFRSREVGSCFVSLLHN